MSRIIWVNKFISSSDLTLKLLLSLLKNFLQLFDTPKIMKHGFVSLCELEFPIVGCFCVAISWLLEN